MTPAHPPTESVLALRGLRLRLLQWRTGAAAAPDAPLLVLLHGWMDVAASFQFLVDALPGARRIVAPDWRGFGGSAPPPGTDAYWFADYLGDLDALLDALAPAAPVDLLGHSMGANVAMLYAGVRPARVRRLVNLEGFGLPPTQAEDAPNRYAAWLDALKTPQRWRGEDSLDGVAERLRRHSPGLSPARAAWLAPHCAAQDDASGRWLPRGDAAHKRPHAVLYRAEEALACWARIEAPVLWVEGRRTDLPGRWGARYPRAEFERRLAVVPRLERAVIDDAGHMLHHEQPEALAAVVGRFLDAP